MGLILSCYCLLCRVIPKTLMPREVCFLIPISARLKSFNFLFLIMHGLFYFFTSIYLTVHWDSDSCSNLFCIFLSFQSFVAFSLFSLSFSSFWCGICGWCEHFYTPFGILILFRSSFLFSSGMVFLPLFLFFVACFVSCYFLFGSLESSDSSMDAWGGLSLHSSTWH